MEILVQLLGMLDVENIVWGPFRSPGTTAPESWKGQKQLLLLCQAEKPGNSEKAGGPWRRRALWKIGRCEPSTSASSKGKL